jgi:heavy metal translocating P-type ATPase
MADSMTTTVLLILNLHCPSCVSVINSALSSLNPSPVSISISTVSHSVTVRHSRALSSQAICDAIHAVAFDIYAVIEQDSSPPLGDDVLQHDKRFEGAVDSWSRSASLDEGDSLRRQAHIKSCTSCKEHRAHRAKDAGDTTPNDPHAAEFSDGANETFSSDKDVTVIVTNPTSLAKVLLSIRGMSCGSCVGKVSAALESKPGVRTVDVSLLTATASVTMNGGGKPEDLIAAIEDHGYEAEIEMVEEIEVDEKPGWQFREDVWKATYSVGGMTCSSCVGNITRALRSQKWIKNADVNLVANSATVVFKGKEHLQDIATLIEDVGYEAHLDRTVDMSVPAESSFQRRVDLRIDGMHCTQCPSRIEEALRVFGDALAVEKPPRLTDPIMRLIYTPRPPDLSLRRIIACISTVDPAFTVMVHHQLSLEERSRRMRTREQWRLAYRLILSIVVAVPSFIIGIVYMSLVPSDDPTRMYLMEPMWVGSVGRAEWALFILATPVYFLAADVFHRRTFKELKTLWRPGSKVPILRRFYRFGSMDMLMSFGTTIAYFASIAEIAIAASWVATDHHGIQKRFTYFDSVVFLTMFLLAGRLLEAYSKAKTGDAVASLGKLRPSEAILVESDAAQLLAKPGQTAEWDKVVGVDLLEIGDTIRVLQGASPPCDGIIVNGDTKFDESSLTGESRLIDKTVGDEVYSGTVNKGSPVLVRITSGIGMSMLDKIVQAVREGQTSRAPIERVADIITSYFVPIVTLIVIITWITWLSLGLSGSLPEDYLDIKVGGWPVWSLQFAIAAFVIACPCGIGLAAPTALFVGGGLAAKYGILAKGGGEAFQEASNLTCIVFDKTGTLTEGGTPAITDHRFVSNLSDRDKARVLGMTSALEQNSSHPLAKAVVAFCSGHNIEALQPTDVHELAGKGMKGSFGLEQPNESQMEVIIGNEPLLADYCVPIAPEVISTLDAWKSKAKSVVLVAVKGLAGRSASTADANDVWELVAIFAVSDPIRPEAVSVLHAIQNRGIEVWMISGDNPQTAYAVGQEVGIPQGHIIAGVLPEEKAKKVQYLQRSLVLECSSFFGFRRRHRKATVAMVGDGINDSPALTMADVGIAIGSGSDVAISSAKFVLISSNLNSLITLIDLSRLVFRRVKFNFGWALVYNVVALPIAAGVLYPVRTPGGDHIRLDPVWASLAMALSSLSVVGSSLSLRTTIPGLGFRRKSC